MRYALCIALLSACLGVAPGVRAENAAIDTVQSPAWVERDGNRLPARPGMALQNRDRLVTGDDARAFVRLADGSIVKLGSGARTEFNALGQRPDGVFGAAIDVVTGAFRLTTDAVRKLTGRRAVNVRVGTITAGIRGTDIWGRSQATDDLICLLEGRIVVSHPLAEPTELTEPLQFYAAARGEAPGPVSLVPPDKIATWAATTELLPATPAYAAGPWAVRLAGGVSEREALSVYDRLGAAGYPARIVPRRGREGYRYEVLSGPLADEWNAQAMAARLAAKLGIADAQAVRTQAALRGRQ